MVNIKDKISNSFIFHILIITFISFFIFLKPLTTIGYPSWADNSLANFNPIIFHEEANFLYVEKYLGLIKTPLFVMYYFFAEKFYEFLSLFTTSSYVHVRLWTVLPFLSLYLVLYCLFRKYFFKPLISLFLTIFYIFSLLNFSWVLYGWGHVTISYIGCVAILLLFISYLRDPNPRLILYIIIATLLAVTNIANFVAIVLICLLVLVLFLFIYKLNMAGFLKTHSNLFYVPILFAIFNAFWILPFLIMFKSNPTALKFRNIYSYSNLNYINTFLFYNNESTHPGYENIFTVFNSLPYKVIFLSLFLCVFYFVYCYARKDNFVLFLFALLLLIFGLCIGPNMKILWSFVSLFPGAFLFRSPQFRFYTPLILVLLLLTGFLISRFNTKILKAIFGVTLLLNVYAFYRGSIFTHTQNIVLPEDYKETVTYFQNGENSREIVLVLPKFDHTPDIIWRNSEVFAWPPLDYIVTNPMIYYIYGNDRIPLVFERVYKNFHTVENLGEYVGQRGVKYILIHKDSADFPFTSDISNSLGIHKVIEDKNLDLYEVTEFNYRGILTNGFGNLDVPYRRLAPGKYLFDGGLILADNSGQCLLHFNRPGDTDIVIYDLEKFNNNLKNYITKPGFNFSDILLLFVPSLDKLNSGDAYGYGNTWNICKKDGDLLLYYRPQIFFYIGIVVTCLGIFLTLIYLFLSQNIIDKLKKRFQKPVDEFLK